MSDSILIDDYKKMKELCSGKSPRCKEWMKLYKKHDIKTSYTKITTMYDSWKEFIDTMENVLITTTVKKIKHKNLIFHDKKTKRQDWRELLKHAEKTSQLRKDASPSQRTAKIGIEKLGKLNETDSIGIVFSSDWHLGSVATDHASFMKNMDYILNTPNLYLAIVGDERDNFLPGFPSGSAIFSQVLTPEQQLMISREVVKELENKGKVLFSCWDNHGDIADERTLGYSVRKAFIDSNKSVFFDGEGIAEIIVDKISYYVMAIHKTRHSSFLNSLWGAKRTYNLRFPANIIVTGHYHDGPAMELYPMYREAENLGLPIGGDNYLIKTGTYKVDDLYSNRHFGTSIIGNPTVVLSAASKNVTFFTNPVKAVTYMESTYSAKKKRR